MGTDSLREGGKTFRTFFPMIQTKIYDFLCTQCLREESAGRGNESGIFKI